MKKKQQVNREIKTQKHKKGQNRGILHERNKETVVENSDQGSWIGVCCAYISLCVLASCMRMHTSSMRMHAEACARIHTLNPNPETKMQKNRAAP